jgi:hypothetical protein
MSVNIIYGITSSTQKFCKSKFNLKENIFVTTNGGEEYENILSLSLIELAKLTIDIDKVIICAEAVTQILTSLQNINIPLKKCYFYNHSKNTLVACKDIITPKVTEEEILYAVYDLSINLPCFDVTNFVILAELERKKRYLKHICFIILPNSSSSDTYIGANQFHEKEDYEWRIDHIIKPVMRGISSCLSIIELPYREKIKQILNTDSHVYPQEVINGQANEKSSTLHLKPLKESGHDLALLTPPRNAVKIIENFLQKLSKGQKLLTVTLREYQEQTVRNNDFTSWAKFLSELDKNEFYPVIIRDSYLSTSPIPKALEEYLTFAEASSDYLVRLALYKVAYINMGVSTGPTYTISFIKNAKSLIFHPLNEDNPASSSMTAKKSGLTIGKDYFFNDNKFQKTVWKPDSYENIKSHFDSLLKLINRS